jgi:carbonic anhydrase
MRQFSAKFVNVERFVHGFYNLRYCAACFMLIEGVITLKTIEDLIQGYRSFRNGAYTKQVELYHALGEGQDPDIMIIGCADSRAEPAEIFNAAPGQLFIMRNVGNLVPPYDTSGGLHGVSAALEYAVTALKVKHIVVMGHGGCGGVSACLSAAQDKPVGRFIAPWVQLLDATRDRILEERHNDPQTALEHAGVGTSIGNLMTFPFVRDAINHGELELHGSWFAIALGELHWRDNQTGRFDKV